MNTFKSITVAMTATVLLAFSPASRAQTTDELQLMQAFLEIMTDYFSIIESTYVINSDPEKAAILQMMKIQEVYEERGEKARSVEVLREVLNDAKMLLGILSMEHRGDDASSMLGSLLVTGLPLDATSRAELPAQVRRPFSYYLPSVSRVSFEDSAVASQACHNDPANMQNMNVGVRQIDFG